jgi:heme/copper-type cytochrome/quinol oxidase subunit 4
MTTQAPRRDLAMGPVLGMWFGLVLIVVAEVVLTYAHLPAGRLLVLLLILAFISAAVGLMYVMRLKDEHPSLFWSLIPYLIFALIMMNHVWPDALRLLHQRLPTP